MRISDQVPPSLTCSIRRWLECKFFVLLYKLILESGCKYRIRGMAVDSEYRNKGIGSKIVNELQRIAEEENAFFCSGIWCNARIKAVPMYSARCGFSNCF